MYYIYIYLKCVCDRSLVDYGELFHKMIMWSENITPQAITSRS